VLFSVFDGSWACCLIPNRPHGAYTADRTAPPTLWPMQMTRRGGCPPDSSSSTRPGFMAVSRALITARSAAVSGNL